jgi:thiol peroxidase
MNTTNKNITFQGRPLTVVDKELKVGDRLPSFELVGTDMKDILSSQFAGRVLVISSVPSLDTPTCQRQTKRFNQETVGFRKEVTVLTVSMDLPFAQGRWCGSEGIKNIVTGSDYKYRTFGETFGTYIQEMGLLTRAVFVVDSNGIFKHVQYVPNISEEPEYAPILQAVSEACD